MAKHYWMLLGTFILILLIAYILYRFNNKVRDNALVKNATFSGAKDALDRLADWAKWLSGIQTAALGALGFLFNDRMGIEKELWFIVTALLLGSALLCSAWVLSSLPSLSLRVHAINTAYPNKLFDIFEMPLYKAFDPIKLSLLLWLQHWYWGLSLGSFVFLLVQLPQYPAKKSDKPPMEIHENVSIHP